MKITFEPIGENGEEEIIIRAAHPNAELLALLDAWQQEQTDGNKLTGFRADKSIFLLHPEDIYYIEAVDDKVFAYGKREVSELKQKLYELENRFAGKAFIRISKSMILNLDKVEKFLPSSGGRFEAVLENREKVLISRQYVPHLKKYLGL